MDMCFDSVSYSNGSAVNPITKYQCYRVRSLVQPSLALLTRQEVQVNTSSLHY